MPSRSNCRSMKLCKQPPKQPLAQSSFAKTFQAHMPSQSNWRPMKLCNDMPNQSLLRRSSGLPSNVTCVASWPPVPHQQSHCQQQSPIRPAESAQGTKPARAAAEEVATLPTCLESAEPEDVAQQPWEELAPPQTEWTSSGASADSPGQGVVAWPGLRNLALRPRHALMLHLPASPWQGLVAWPGLRNLVL